MPKIVVCALIYFPFCCKLLYSWFRYTLKHEMKLRVFTDKNNLLILLNRQTSLCTGRQGDSFLKDIPQCGTCNVQKGIVSSRPTCQPENAIYAQVTSLMLSNHHVVTSYINQASLLGSRLLWMCCSYVLLLYQFDKSC